MKRIRYPKGIKWHHTKRLHFNSIYSYWKFVLVHPYISYCDIINFIFRSAMAKINSTSQLLSATCSLDIVSCRYFYCCTVPLEKLYLNNSVCISLLIKWIFQICMYIPTIKKITIWDVGWIVRKGMNEY